MSLAAIRIVLVEPAGALNVGSVARVMKNMGLHQLVCVNPQCDVLGAEARLMAVRGLEVLESAQQVSTLPEALMGCRRVIATTGADRKTTLNVELEPPRVALPWLLEGASTPAALIFGREDRGLTKEELNYAQRFVQIPTSPDYLSLNLAQAVAICCYELTCYELTCGEVEHPGEKALPSVHPVEDLATFDHSEGYYQQLAALLIKIGYLHPHTAASRMEKVRRLYSRAQLSAAEVAMLRGMVSQMQWALQTGVAKLSDPETQVPPPSDE